MDILWRWVYEFHLNCLKVLKFQTNSAKHQRTQIYTRIKDVKYGSETKTAVR